VFPATSVRDAGVNSSNLTQVIAGGLAATRASFGELEPSALGAGGRGFCDGVGLRLDQGVVAVDSGVSSVEELPGDRAESLAPSGCFGLMVLDQLGEGDFEAELARTTDTAVITAGEDAPRRLCRAEAVFHCLVAGEFGVGKETKDRLV